MLAFDSGVYSRVKDPVTRQSVDEIGPGSGKFVVHSVRRSEDVASSLRSTAEHLHSNEATDDIGMEWLALLV
jgi:hypothetical protein